MMPVLLSATMFSTLVWLLKVWYTNKKHQQLLLAQKQLQNYVLQIDFAAMQEKHNDLLDFYSALGQSIAALHIQLQVAQKLWHINPTQAQMSLTEAYQLSSALAHELRQTVRNMGQVSFK